MNKRDLDGYKYCLDKAKSNKHKNFYNYLSYTYDEVVKKNQPNKKCKIHEQVLRIEK